MGRPRKPDALTAAERMRRYREAKRTTANFRNADGQPDPLRKLDYVAGSFCPLFNWAKGCTLDLMQRRDSRWNVQPFPG
jgi:hypothetical protein